MVWVNLLPWRKRRISQRLRRDIVLLALMVAGLIVVGLCVQWRYAADAYRTKTIALYHDATRQAGVLQQQAESLRQQKQALMARLAALHQRQRNMEQWHHFAQNLATYMPDALWLTDMRKTPDSLRLTGVGGDVHDVHLFRQRLHALDLFQQVDTEKISRDEQGRMTFTLLAALQRSES